MEDIISGVIILISGEDLYPVRSVEKGILLL